MWVLKGRVEKKKDVIFILYLYVYIMFHEFNYLEFIQVWQMAENIYNDEEPDAQAADIGNYNTF